MCLPNVKDRATSGFLFGGGGRGHSSPPLKNSNSPSGD